MTHGTFVTQPANGSAPAAYGLLTVLMSLALLALGVVGGRAFEAPPVAPVATKTTVDPADYVYDGPAQHSRANLEATCELTHLRTRLAGQPSGQVHQGHPMPLAFFAAEGEGGALARLGAAMADDTGAIGPGVGDLKFARKVGLDVNNPAIANRAMTVQDFISQYPSASVLREFPGEFLDQTVEQALRAGDSTVRKLLTDGRFAR